MVCHGNGKMVFIYYTCYISGILAKNCRNLDKAIQMEGSYE